MTSIVEIVVGIGLVIGAAAALIRKYRRRKIVESVFPILANSAPTQVLVEPAVQIAAVETYEVSGNVGVADAQVFAIDQVAHAKQTISNQAGFYSFDLSNGTYTILPYKAGETFRPVQADVIVDGADVTVSFIDPSSVVDSRIVPNHGRTVQGTIFYDIVPNDSRAVPALTPTFSITSVASAVGGQTTYTGTFTPSALPVNSVAEVAGFANAPNNGSFQVVSVNATTLVLANAAGVAEVHAATAIPFFPVDSRTAGPQVDSRVAGNIPQNSRT